MPDVVSYNTIISCFSEQACADDALKLLNSMLCKPDTISFNAVFKCLCRAERWYDAAELIAKMLKEGCHINEMTFNQSFKSRAIEFSASLFQTLLEL